MNLFSDKSFLLTISVVSIAALICLLGIDGWLIFNFAQQFHSTGDPNQDQYLGFFGMLYVIFFILPALAATAGDVFLYIFLRKRLKKISQKV